MPSLDSEGHKDAALPLAEASTPPSGPAQGGTSAMAQPESTVTSSHSSDITTTTETAAPTIVRPDPNSGGSESTDTAARTSTVIQSPSATDSRTTSTTSELTIIQPNTDTDASSNIYRPPTSTDTAASSIYRPNTNDTSYLPTAINPDTLTTQPIPTLSPVTRIQPPPNKHTDTINIPNSNNVHGLSSLEIPVPSASLAVPTTDSESRLTETIESPTVLPPAQTVLSTTFPHTSATSASSYPSITQRPPNQILSSIDAFPPTFVAIAPLTTDFRPPDSCASLGQFKNYVESPESDSSAPKNIFTWKYGQSCGQSSMVGADCLPFPFAESLTKFAGTVGFATTLPVFSPADRCPQGYSGACTMVPTRKAADPKGSTLQWPALGSTQVAIGCCPSGYECYGGGRSCISTVFPGATVPYNDCGSSSTITFDLTMPTSALGYGFAVQAVYVQDDPNHTLFNGSIGDGSAGDSNHSHGLSTGAKAAIGIAVPLVSILLGAIGFILYRKRKRAHMEGSEDGLDGFASPSPNSYFGTLQSDLASPISEADGSGKELDRPKSSLLPPVEMPGDFTFRATDFGSSRADKMIYEK